MLRVLMLVLIIFSSPALYGKYRAAQRDFVKGNYRKAAARFFQVMNYPKARGDKIKSEWGLARSLQKIGFYYSASKYYSIIVRRGVSKKNIFFRKAFEQLGEINSTINLGQSHIVQLLKTRVTPSRIPGAARGFYFHYQGIEAFYDKNYSKARAAFRKVPAGSSYYTKSLFYLGILANMDKLYGRAISYFMKVKSNADTEWQQESANINIARVHYEAKRYRQALRFYAEIPRESDNWLQALFEGAWAFFLMKKYNNTLGNIHTFHSPFFINRFYPETYVLQAITFLSLCRYDNVKLSMQNFKKRYTPVFKDLRKLINRYRGDYSKFFMLIKKYRRGSLDSYKYAHSILDSLSRRDIYKEALTTIRFSTREIDRLENASRAWLVSGLIDELKSFLAKKRSVAMNNAGVKLIRGAQESIEYLTELYNQTRFIKAELLLGKVDKLRLLLRVTSAEKKVRFIGGMQEITMKSDLEFWPFENEYWEDELGGYVYDIVSSCKK